MIYGNNNEPVVLTENAADEFLQSVGVELYETAISIDGIMYEGSFGEQILAENGIELFEDHIVVEGELIDAAKKLHASKKAYVKDLKNDPDYKQGMKDYKKSTVNNAKQYLRDRRTVGKDAAKDNWLKNSARDYERMQNNPGIKRQADKHALRVASDGMEFGSAVVNTGRKIADAKDKVKERAKAVGNKLTYGKKKSTNESTIFSDIEII